MAFTLEDEATDPAEPEAAPEPAVLPAQTVPVVRPVPVPEAAADLALPERREIPALVTVPADTLAKSDITPGATAAPPARIYGPVDSGASSGDSERVGTAPNGEPMYAARWYREPTRAELAGYLSTASPPSRALITCRTVSEFRVEDCVLLEEWPRGSDIGRAVLAATWQFKVRPPRIGGRSQVGSWVRIRIDYTVNRR